MFFGKLGGCWTLEKRLFAAAAFAIPLRWLLQ